MIAPKPENPNAQTETSNEQQELASSDNDPNLTNNATPAETSQPKTYQQDLIPARMLNEFTYCPRLGYLEFVHGEWADNYETKNGTFGHRRVDKADRKNVPQPTGDHKKPDQAQSSTKTMPPKPDSKTKPQAAAAAQLHARSLLLSAPNEGLIAKLDLVELVGMKATPVDYKRGTAPKVPEGAYEPERTQLCAQGLILRENGFQCHEGILYFIASKQRVIIPFTDELIERTRQLRRQFEDVAQQGEVPAPLVDSPKCSGCSLVGVCLPDELVYLNSIIEPIQHNSETATQQNTAHPESPDFHLTHSNQDPSIDRSQSARKESLTTPYQLESAAPRIRKLLPANDHATPFYVQEFGAMLGKSGDRLQVKKKGQVIGERRLKDVSQVSLFGGVIVSAQALSELLSRGISICHVSHGGWFHGITSGLVHKNVELRIRQYQVARNPSEAVQIARQLISGKIRNGRTLLRRHLGKHHKPLLDKLERYRRKAEATTSIESLLGIEGMAAKEYFGGLFELMNGRHDFNVNDRNRRPPRDPVNAVLSFGYALLTKELTVVLQSVGFDPMLGVLHQPRYGRPSLALDLAEEYRHLIVDSVMLTAFNNGELSSDRFLERAGAVTLTSAGRAALIAAFERRMTTEITHPIFGYKISYRRLLEVQSRLLARTLLGEIQQYPAFCTR